MTLLKTPMPPAYDSEGAGAGTTGTGAAGAGTGAAPGEELKFSQNDVNRFLAEERRRGKSAAAATTAVVPPEVATELDTLRREKEERERKEAEARGEYERVKASMAQEHQKKLDQAKTEREALVAELERDRIHNAILSAAAKGNAIDPEDVVALVRGKIKLNATRQPVVLDAEGNVRLQGGNPITVEAFVSEYLAAKPHLVKPSSIATGSGARSGVAATGGAVGGKLDQAREKYEAAFARAQKSGEMGDRRRAQDAFNELQKVERGASAA